MSMPMLTATFVATRRELEGDDVLLGSAELARAAVGTAARRIAVVAVTRERLRRVDAWAGDAIVTHPAATSPSDRVVGTLSDRAGATDLVTAIVESLIGRLPDGPAPNALELEALSAWTPADLPASLDALVAISSVGEWPAPTLLVARHRDGLVAGETDDLERVGRVLPATRSDVTNRWCTWLAPRPPSLAELLAD